MKYKQYIPEDIDCKMICSLDSYNLDAINNLAECGSSFEQNNFRTMTIEFLEEDSNGDECLGFSYETYGVESNLATQRFYHLLLGRFENVQPVRVDLDYNSVSFLCLRFCDNGKVGGEDIIHLTDFPPHIKIKVKMEKTVELEPDTYIIINRSESSRIMEVSVEEYKDSQLVRISELNRDDLGSYELITEV